MKNKNRILPILSVVVFISFGILFASKIYPLVKIAPKSIITPVPSPVIKDYTLDQKLSVAWGDYVFTKVTSTDTGYYLYKKNVNTKAEEFLIKIEPDNKESELTYMYLYNNSLYVVISGYISPSFVYYIETPSSEPQDITPPDTTPYRLDLHNGKLILVEGFGDFCYYYSNYYVLEGKADFEKRASDHGACEPGTAMLGYYKGNFVFADHDNILNPPDNTVVSNNQKYVNLYLVNIDNPNQKITLIDSMPGIVDLIYFDDDENLSLSGNGDWNYNIPTQTLSDL